MQQIRIAIIDPRQLIREGFEKLLRRPLFDVVAAGRTLADAFGGAGMARADVVVLGHSTKTEVEAQIAALRPPPFAGRAAPSAFRARDRDRGA